MAELKAGEPFGLDPAMSAKINWNLALERIIQDLRTDFIYAPHLGFIYRRAGDELVNQVKAQLSAGQYSPGLPVTIEVPKPFRIRVTSTLPRLGPNYSRPGSILLPSDRLFYQALADHAAPLVKAKSDRTRSFSHQLAPTDSPNMFLPTRTCWNALQKALGKHAECEQLKYVLKVDVANFFGSLNLHTLINVLKDAGYEKGLAARLEAILLGYTGERSSRGILQGMYPSDLFGNYYLVPIDRFLDDYGVPSARYVDDLYIFVESVEATDHLLRQLIPKLRTYDLVLNEAKSVVMWKLALKTEEPDLELLFDAAVQEIAQQVDDDEFDADYGFQSEWDEEEEEEEDDAADDESLELKATMHLFASLPNYQGQEENIERFCLPLFSKGRSDYAVSHVLDSFKKRPAMAQIYASYLAKFLDNDVVYQFMTGLLSEPTLVDWQKIWILAALSQRDAAQDAALKQAMALLNDANRHDALRAVAAIFVGRFGDHSRRKDLGAIYASVSEYVKAAIYYSSRRWPMAERSNARVIWGNHGPLNKLITIALTKK
jgi:hypothetical protein